MDTKILPVNEASLEKAARLLRDGQVVGMPTETVYGLAANAMDGNAVKRIFAAKGRPVDNPLIAHIDSMKMLPLVVHELPEKALRLAEKFWPGPLTMVLSRAEGVAVETSAGLDTVAVRMPANIAARSLICAAGFPLAAPSANRSGSPSPTTAAHVLADMEGKIPLILDGGACPVGVESTVITMVGEPAVLRPGFVTVQELEEILGGPVRLHETALQPLEKGRQPASPGMKYKHYAPKAKLIVLEGSLPAFSAYVENYAQNGAWALCFEGEEGRLPVPAIPYGSVGDGESQAKGLFAALRRLDEEGVREAYVRAPAHTGVSLAVYNRLLRASGFQVKEV